MSNPGGRSSLGSGVSSTSVSSLSTIAGPPCGPRATGASATVPPRRRRTTRRTWPLRTARGSPAAPVVEVSLRPILGGPSVRRRDGGTQRANTGPPRGATGASTYASVHFIGPDLEPDGVRTGEGCHAQDGAGDGDQNASGMISDVRPCTLGDGLATKLSPPVPARSQPLATPRGRAHLR